MRAAPRHSLSYTHSDAHYEKFLPADLFDQRKQTQEEETQRQRERGCVQRSAQ